MISYLMQINSKSVLLIALFAASVFDCVISITLNTFQTSSQNPPKTIPIAISFYVI